MRDNYRCVICGDNSDIEAHHVVALSILIDIYNITSLEEAHSCKELWDINNGETRCYSCHKVTKVGR
jgi:5-methylcytosine-specific restriction endonuclease McrA